MYHGHCNGCCLCNENLFKRNKKEDTDSQIPRFFDSLWFNISIIISKFLTQRLLQWLLHLIHKSKLHLCYDSMSGSVRLFVHLIYKSLIKTPFPLFHINIKHRPRIFVTQGTFLAISGESWRADMENISIFVIFYPLVNKSIYKSLSVRLFVYWICKSLIKTPFPSIHINFKHRFGILVTQGWF